MLRVGINLTPDQELSVTVSHAQVVQLLLQLMILQANDLW